MKKYKDNVLDKNGYKKMKKEKHRKFRERKKLNKKGNFAMTMIIAVVFFMFGILIIGLIFPDIAIARSLDSLDCTNMTISDGNKLACLGVDGIVPAFIISLVIIGGGAVILKLTGMS